jgi:hypothetical protein
VGDCGFDVGVVDREFWFPIEAAAARERVHGLVYKYRDAEVVLPRL